MIHRMFVQHTLSGGFSGWLSRIIQSRSRYQLGTSISKLRHYVKQLPEYNYPAKTFITMKNGEAEYSVNDKYAFEIKSVKKRGVLYALVLLRFCSGVSV